jgi:UDP-N-acetyl-D-mannosaminuronic acid dehydrogenase
MKELASRIASRKAAIGVVGLGHVGLAVAAAFAEAGFHVIGHDLDRERVRRIAAGECPIEGREPELPALLRDVVASERLVATASIEPLAAADAILIAVETPVSEADRRPAFAALEAACRSVGRVMKAGALVIVESTLAPGTCDRVVAPLLAEASGRTLGEGFFLGHCPERVMPGKLLANLRGMPRVCGGACAETREAMIALYRTVVGAPLEASDCVTAEIVKTAENAWRDVNIAFANEVGLVCEAAGADFDRVRELVNQSPGRSLLAAGAGVGGPCVPKDPWLLAHGVDLRLVAAARAVNDGMPAHVARLVERALEDEGVARGGARVAVLGVAYLENGAGTANSPSLALAASLRERGLDVALHDPFVAAYAGEPWAALRGANAAVLMVAHDAYRDLDLDHVARALATPVLVDGRRLFDAARARAAGLRYLAVGASSATPTRPRRGA